jgi:hypothetical protein
VAAVVLFLTCCNWETHEVKSEDIHIFVPEQRFREVRVQMTPDQVTRTIGTPRAKEKPAGEEIWRYGVFRAESPSFRRALFGRAQPSAILLEGRVTFRADHVVSSEVVESTAKPFPPKPAATTPTQ